MPLSLDKILQWHFSGHWSVFLCFIIVGRIVSWALAFMWSFKAYMDWSRFFWEVGLQLLFCVSDTWGFPLLTVTLTHVLEFIELFSPPAILLFGGDPCILIQSGILPRNWNCIFSTLSFVEYGIQIMFREVVNQCWNVWTNRYKFVDYPHSNCLSVNWCL
jgi:hypothetical protein